MTKVERCKKILAEYDNDRERTVEFPTHWSDCPVYWRDFIRSLSFSANDSSTKRNEVINAELCIYHAKKTRSDIGVPPKLIFDTVSHKNWFILRWS
jgi:hypothetical protein